jgi:hypothetical protein
VVTDQTQDVNILLFLEYNNSKVVVVQHAMSNSLDTIVTLDNINLHGFFIAQFNDLDYGHEALRVTLISKGEVSFFSFYINEQTWKDADIV